jgi:D-glycero-D-manno-heptose 1,7-bisphosphate phosphatase
MDAKIKAVFLDRDGVINKDPGGTDYVTKWQEFEFLPGVKKALKELNSKGYKIFIISNQAGVSKGIYTKQALDEITRNMLKGLSDDTVIEGVYYCIHKQEDNCSCRKPKAGMVSAAISDFKSKGASIDLENSFFIGDTIRDIQTGKNARLKTVLVFSGKEKPQNKDSWETIPDLTAQDLSGAVKLITHFEQD